MPSPKSLLSIVSPERPQALAVASRLGPLSATLRGGSQPTAQLLQQLAGRPGVKRSALEQVFGHVDPAARHTPMSLSAEAHSPKLFAQRGVLPPTLSDEAIEELATDLSYSDPGLMQRRLAGYHGILESDRGRELLNALGDEGRDLRNYLHNHRELLRRGDEDAMALFGEHLDDLRSTYDGPGLMLMRTLEETAWDGGLMDDAYRLAEESAAADPAKYGAETKSFGPQYAAYQRQPLATDLQRQGAEYFETALRGTPGLAQRYNLPTYQGNWGNYHFSNPSQLGHIRGVIDDRGILLEELQSDPLEHLTNAKDIPQLSNIYGLLGRMAVDRAAQAGVPGVMIPDARRIASVRSQRQLPFFSEVYDKQLPKQLYDPLSAKGFDISYDNGFYNIGIPPHLAAALKRGDLGPLNYARGGRVRRGCA